MEQYFVVAKLVENTKTKYEDYRIIKFDATKPIDDQIPAGYKKMRDPTSLDDCVKWLKEINGNTSGWFGLTVAQYLLIGVVTLAFVWVIVYGSYNLQGLKDDAGKSLITSSDDAARILITFLVAVATVAIALLATLTAMVIREYKERFALAKEILTILVGILGTIVGFYFGTATNPNVKPPAANANTASPTPTQTPSNTNTNTTAQILRLPSGKERLISFAADKNGKRKIVMQ